MFLQNLMPTTSEKKTENYEPEFEIAFYSQKLVLSTKLRDVKGSKESAPSTHSFWNIIFLKNKFLLMFKFVLIFKFFV